MLEVAGDAEQANQFLVIEDLRQTRRRLCAGHVEVRVGNAERNAEQKQDSVPYAVAALPAQSPLFMQEEQVVLDFLRRDPLRTTTVVSRKSGDGLQVGSHGVLGKAANTHVVQHSFS